MAPGAPACARGQCRQFGHAGFPSARPRGTEFDLALPAAPPIALARTDPGHQASPDADAPSFARTTSGFQIRPAGNAVSLEDEMMKIADNQMDFQTVSALYSKGLGLIKLAVGKK